MSYLILCVSSCFGLYARAALLRGSLDTYLSHDRLVRVASHHPKQRESAESEGYAEKEEKLIDSGVGTFFKSILL